MKSVFLWSGENASVLSDSSRGMKYKQQPSLNDIMFHCV
jgi:hypothetical protein